MHWATNDKEVYGEPTSSATYWE